MVRIINVKWKFVGSERTWGKTRKQTKQKTIFKTKNKHFLRIAWAIHVPSSNPKLLKESRFTCVKWVSRKWQRYLNIHFLWEIILRKYAIFLHYGREVFICCYGMKLTPANSTNVLGLRRSKRGVQFYKHTHKSR